MKTPNTNTRPVHNNNSDNLLSKHPERINQILASLPPQSYKRLVPYLEPVPLKAGQILREANELGQFAYFPVRGLVSISVVTQDGRGIEIATIGKEGFVGVPLLLGDERASFRATVQIAGEALRITADRLRRLLPALPRLQRDLHGWLETHISEIAQHAACNSLHPISQRLSRCLLLSYLRTGCDLLPITHDTLAQVLGCRRSSVTAAANLLQRARLIAYRRGQIRILNPTAMQEAACECYRTIQRYQFNRVHAIGSRNS